METIVNDEILSCPICFERYESAGSRIPKMLNCFHGYCETCLNDISHEKSGRITISCPTCRTETEVSNIGELRANFTILHLLDVIKIHDPVVPSPNEEGAVLDGFACIICGLSTTTDGPIHGCVDCEGMMCFGCGGKHLVAPLFRGHKLVKYDEFLKVMSVKKKQTFQKCKKHAGKELEFYCTDCEAVLCPTCFALDHSGHKLVSLEKGAEFERLRIQQGKEKAEITTSRLTREFDALGEIVASFEASIEHQHNAISDVAKSILELVSQKEREAHANLNEKSTVILKRWKAHKDSLDCLLLRAKSCNDFVDRATLHGTDVDICESSREIQKVLKALAQFQSAYSPSITESVANGASTVPLDPIVLDGAKLGGGGAAAAAAVAAGHMTGEADSVHDMTSFARDIQFQLQFELLNDFHNHQIEALLDRSLKTEIIRTPWPIARGPGSIEGSPQLENHSHVAVRVFGPAGLGAPSLLYATDSENKCIQVIDALTGESRGAFRVTSGPTIFKKPFGIALRDGRSHGISSESGSVAVPDRFGKGPKISGSGGVVGGGGGAAAVGGGDRADIDQPTLFVTDTDSNIFVINADTGEVVRTIGTGKGSEVSQLNGPRGVALLDIDSSAAVSGESAVKGAKVAGEAKAVAAAAAKNQRRTLLFVAELGNCRVQVFDADTGEHIRMIGAGMGAGAGQLHFPRGLCIRSGAAGSNRPPLLYVADNSNHRIQVYNAITGDFVHTIGGAKDALQPGSFLNPYDVAVQEARASPHSYSMLGSTTGAVGTSAVASAQATNVDIDVKALPEDTRSLLYISDSTNSRIQVFDADTGEFVGTVGSKGSGPGQFLGPHGLALHSAPDGDSLLFVCDRRNHRVEVLKLDGNAIVP